MRLIVALLVDFVLWLGIDIFSSGSYTSHPRRDSNKTLPLCVVNDDGLSCSYNGLCVRSNCNTQETHCLCDPGWKGMYCEALDLVPVANGSGLQDLLTQNRTSTWGGSVLFDQGVYHMFFSELAHHCGIHRWISHSVVSHAVSAGPEDNWKFHKTKTLLPIFSHEPIVTRDPSTGELGLFVSHYPHGSAADDNDSTCHCVDGSTSSALEKRCIHEPGLGHNKTMYTYFTTAHQPTGPWSPLQSLEHETPEGQKRFDLNFAPLILPTTNRSLSLLAWTRWDIWTATDWKNPHTYVRQGPAPNFSNPHAQWEGEDPSLWRDSKGRFHILSHNGPRGIGGPEGDCGRHLFSATGQAGSWLAAPLPLGGCAFPRVNVSFVDGSSRTFYRRERPHLIFGPHGRPAALSTSVIDSPVGPGVPGFQPPQRDASYTLVQATHTGRHFDSTASEKDSC
ncbi:expressed unknown protein [Seminavis robusta]|uniref:EGF-like domain-containing protein n=1 Tax=Seminavis robusta TaxID=568900 RepID=A0A9N8EGF8_9STRA|nr:expressed unknown protein [Seminavis robusta]|eukprot:Sro1059_g236510.1 n/a (449) ;mRNA; r:13306-14652